MGDAVEKMADGAIADSPGDSLYNSNRGLRYRVSEAICDNSRRERKLGKLGPVISRDYGLDGEPMKMAD